MGKEILTFGDTEIEKTKFYCNKIPIFGGEKNYKYFIWLLV